MFKATLMQKILFNTIQRGVDECWGWRLSHNQAGYPLLYWQGKTRLVTRLVAGTPKHLHNRHTCDNPGCMNPTHWLPGTPKDNMNDRETRGRGNQPKGSKNAAAKLTEDQVRQIRQLKNMTMADIARKFGVSHGIVSRIRRWKNWIHVT